MKIFYSKYELIELIVTLIENSFQLSKRFDSEWQLLCHVTWKNVFFDSKRSFVFLSAFRDTILWLQLIHLNPT